ncbi:MAG: class I lanthipeptide [Bacteroidota bacterium]
MKKIQLNKKLVLNKETIANLNNEQMTSIKGGLIWSDYCLPPSCCGINCVSMKKTGALSGCPVCTPK